MKNPARGGGRWVEVAPERLPAWAKTFSGRHPDVTAEITGSDAVTFSSADGASAECHLPFPPLVSGAPLPGGLPAGIAECAGLIAGHAQAARTVGVLLVRLGGYAAGVFTGAPPRLAASKVGSRLVHGRSAAGGTSQHRFARRREKQAAQAMSAAADNAAAVFGQFGGGLDALVLGGDRRAVTALRADVRLGPYFALATDRFLTVPDPRLAVLRDTPRMFQAIRIRLTEPPEWADLNGPPE